MSLDLLRTPAPTITALTAPFWKAAEEGRLSIQHCEECDVHVFYPRPICPHCWSDKLVWKDASGHATLKSFSVVHKPGHPGWLPIVPYTVGMVELEEGPTMLTFILRDAGDELDVGAAVHMVPTRIGGRNMPAFKQSRSQERT